MKELRALSDGELQKELIDSQKELFNLRMQRGTGQMPKPHLFQKAKKRIARIQTLLTEKAKS